MIMTTETWLWLTDAALLFIAFAAGRWSVRQERQSDVKQLRHDTDEALRRVDEMEKHLNDLMGSASE